MDLLQTTESHPEMQVLKNGHVSVRVREGTHIPLIFQAAQLKEAFLFSFVFCI